MKIKEIKLNLQMFATQTTLLPDLSDEMKVFYSDTLIDLAEPKLVHNQFGEQYDIPKNGGKTIEFRKYDPLPKATTPITEGVTPVGNNLKVTTITAEVHQFGDYIVLSDMLILTAIDNNVIQATKLLGSQSGLTLDSITRDVINGGSNVIYAGDKPSRGALTMSDTLTVDLIRQAATVLAAQNAPTAKDSDSYVAILHPYSRYDLVSSTDWIDIHKYADPEAIFEGEVGKIDNVRFVQSTEAKIWKDSTCPSDGASGNLAVFSTMVIGGGAYAVTKITGGGLQHIVKQLGYGDDPLNQRSSVGWKATATAERLVEQYMVRLESCSKYSKKASAN